MDAISLLAHACISRSVSETDLQNQDKLQIDTTDLGLSIEKHSTEVNSIATNSPLKSSSRGNWTTEEDELLRSAVQVYGGRNWKKISDLIPDRTDVQCLHRWQKVLRPGLVKGPWLPEVSCLTNCAIYLYILLNEYNDYYRKIKVSLS